MLKDSSMCSDDNDSHVFCFVSGVQGGPLDLYGRDR